MEVKRAWWDTRTTEPESGLDCRAACDADRLAYKGALRVASVATVLELGALAEDALPRVRTPFLCCVAEREYVLGPAARAAQEELVKVAATPPERRKLRRYDALHGILCEPPDKRAVIVEEICEWMRAEAEAGPPAFEGEHSLEHTFELEAA